MRASMREREREREEKEEVTCARMIARAKDRKRAADYYFSQVHQTNSFLLERGVWRYETRTRCIYSICDNLRPNDLLPFTEG